ncbi:MAG: succinate dehydrogenase, cytochrome b556 subunit [Parvularcula sp.]
MPEPAHSTRPMFTPAIPPEDRPLSPHLQVWRWTVTMASSILQRATGVALYAGFALLTAFLAAAALGEGAFTTVKGLLSSPLGLFVLIGFTWAQMFHLAKGILHLFWDSGRFISKDAGKTGAIITIAASILLTAGLWATAFGLKG